MIANLVNLMAHRITMDTNIKARDYSSLVEVERPTELPVWPAV